MYVKLVNVFMGWKKMRVLKKKKKANHFWQISIAMYGKYKNLKQIEKKLILTHNTPSVYYNCLACFASIYTKLILRVHIVSGTTYLNLAMSRLTRRMKITRRKTNIARGDTQDPYVQPPG